MVEKSAFQPARLARDLGLTVVAEGIETYDQLIYLHAYNCEEGQGYYFSVPLTANELVARIKSGNGKQN